MTKWALLAIAALAAAANAQPTESWHKALELGQEGLAKLFPEGKLPVQIAGEAFTEENLKLWFELKAPTGQTENSLSNVDAPVPVMPKVGGAAVPILKLMCKLGCSKFVELLGNQDTYDKRTLQAAVIPDEAKSWDSISEVKGSRQLSGNHWSWENVFGTTLVDIWFRWEFYYGGRYANRGAYLTSVMPVVSVENGALQACEFATKALNHRNVGTDTAPIAAVDIEITLYCSGTHTIMATFRGDGEAYAWNNQGGYLGKDGSIDPSPRKVPTTAPTTAPTSAPALTSGCFDGASTVTLGGGSGRAMADLRLGDVVETAPGRFEPVLLLPKHWVGLARGNANHLATFQRIRAGQHVVTLTGDHQIYVATGNQTLALKRADQVRQGDFVLTESSRFASVERNDVVDSAGLYTPYTQSLKLMVGGLQTSCLIDHPWLASGLVLSLWAFASACLSMLLALLGPAAYGAVVDIVCFAVVEPCYWYPSGAIFALAGVALMAARHRHQAK